MTKTPTSVAANNFLSEKIASTSTAATISLNNPPPESVGYITEFFSDTTIPDKSLSYNFYSHFISHILKPDLVQRGRVSCTATVLPSVINSYNGLHGGAVAAIAERVAIACARTVVAEDKEIFLGELSMSYLSAAQQNEVLVVDGSVVRSGRNLTVVAMEFKIKETQKPVYLARATFYHMPVAKL
ncbi:uncharacterized protein LOC126653853 [Mercurialis annua]|uniref:uncharacterized protein LOC126653853 n=1 Tax=Mercurialis annua TaxID=3986 RepID=UPI002160DE9C|nr:uncharacterized protein LOC126653853 [Mercurialis annua]